MMVIRPLLPVLVSFAPVLAHAAFENCRDYFPNHTPPRIEQRAQQRDICFDSFAVLHSGESKTPVFAVEKLNPARLVDAKDEVRTNKFYPEARLPSADRAQLDDYKNSGYDRGHMAPAADMPNSNAIAQSFSLANMVSQAPENNRGIWARAVESTTRKYVMRAAGDVFVFTGPVFQHRPVQTIGPGRVWVPSHLFKLVYDSSNGKAWAYWVENTDTARMSAPITYQELVRRTGIEFLPGVSVKHGGNDVGEAMSAPPAQQPTENPAAAQATDRTCYTGPRGGTYTLTPSGHKNYGGC